MLQRYLLPSVWVLLTAASAGADSTLLWTNGDRSQGTWLSLSEGWLEWRTPLVRDPVRLWMPRLLGWDAAPSSPSTTAILEEGLLRLQDGSFFGASRLGKATAEWTLENQHAGDLRMAAHAVVEWRRLRPEGALKYAGPGGSPEWMPNAPGPSPVQRWAMAPGGVLRTRSIDQATSLPLFLPARTRLDFWLRTDQKNQPPHFSLRVRRQGQSCELVTWLEELVGHGEGAPAHLDTLFESNCAWTLCIDFSSGLAQAFDHRGKEKGRWQISGRFSPNAVVAPGSVGSGLLGMLANALAQGAVNQQRVANDRGKDQIKDIENGLTLVNTGANLTLERLLVREWDGRPPSPRPIDQPFIELLDGSVREGAITAIRAGQVQQESGERTSLADVAWISMPATRDYPNEAFTPGTASARLHFADQSLFQGRLRTADAQRLSFQPEWSDGLVTAQREHLTSVRWHEPETLAGPLTNNHTHQDVLASEPKGPRFRGQWVPAADSLPHWRFDGGANSGLLVPTQDWSLQRPLPDPTTPPKTLPSLAHLDSGEVVPVEIIAWQSNQTRLHCPWSLDPQHCLPFAHVRCIDLAGPGLQTNGFGDHAWTPLPGSSLPTISPDHRSAKLPPGSRLGHGSLLQGNQFHFALSGDSYGSLRLRLFTDGLQEKSPHLSLLVYFSGDTLYCGVEDPRRPGQMTGSNHRVPIEPNKPAHLMLKWSAQQLEFHASGMLLFRQNLSEKLVSGTGLILEPASMWGNPLRSCTVSHLQMRHFPGARARPAFDADTRAWSLSVPRRLADDPPRHLLLAANGDLLRGTLEALDDRQLTLRSGLEEWRVPRTRVHSILLPAALPKAEKAPRTPATKPPQGLWIRTRQGGRLCLQVRALGPHWIEGDSLHLGPCRLPVEEVFSLSNQPPQDALHPNHGLEFQLNPEPALEAASKASPLMGQQAPDFKLNLANGGVFDLQKARGQVIVLDFWASWCGPCLMSIPQLIEAMKGLPSDQVKLVGVNLGQPRAEVERFLQARDWDFTSALDFDQKVAPQFGATAIPHTVVIDATGKIAHVQTGHTATSTQQVVQAVRALLKPTDP